MSLAPTQSGVQTHAPEIDEELDVEQIVHVPGKYIVMKIGDTVEITASTHLSFDEMTALAAACPRGLRLLHTTTTGPRLLGTKYLEVVEQWGPARGC